MKFRSSLFAAVLSVACVAPFAHALPIDYFTGSLNTPDPTHNTVNSTQLGRPSRSGTAQQWTHPENYTGQINPATLYYTRTYTFDASNFVGANYIDISVFDENNTGAFFVSAFADSYNPSDRGRNWLGDEGSSGNITFYPNTIGDARDFQVFLPTGSSLVLLVNSTLGGTNGLDQPFDIAINAYADTDFNDPVPAAPTPEPGSIVLTLTGLLGTAGAVRRRYLARA